MVRSLKGIKKKMKHHRNFQDYLNERDSQISEDEREMRQRSLMEDGPCSEYWEDPRRMDEPSDYPYPDGFEDDDFDDLDDEE